MNVKIRVQILNNTERVSKKIMKDFPMIWARCWIYSKPEWEKKLNLLL